MCRRHGGKPSHGTVLLGVLGTTDPAGGNTLASINPAEIWQRPALSVKSNYKSDAPAPNAEPSEVAELKPYSEVVVFRQRPTSSDPSEAPTDDLARGHRRHCPSGSGAEGRPGRRLSLDQRRCLPYSSPTVIDGSFQVASLDTGANITIITKTLPEPVDETITLAKNGPSPMRSPSSASPSTRRMLSPLPSSRSFRPPR